MTSIQQELFALQDTGYRDFHARLIPTVPKESIIGVRTPALRKLAKAFAKTPEAEAFLLDLPHTYYEENNLHAFLLETRRDYAQLIEELNRFLPYVDNWATCDMMSPKLFKKHLPELYQQIPLWLQSQDVYTVRFAIGMLMQHYLDEAFLPEYPAVVAAVQSEEYYINMMIAWYFATALAKQYDAVLPYLLQHRLSPWVHNKTIQKAVESNRIPKETKQYLRTLKRK
ncbi:MAG: DNA alkylation repair protein [Eubacteriales bacterium]|nr:DNA alkylation repair protein [Eubacteriales bacterium]